MRLPILSSIVSLLLFCPHFLWSQSNFKMDESKNITAAAFTHNSQYLIAGLNKEINIYNNGLKPSLRFGPIKTPTKKINEIVVTPDNQHYLFCGGDNEIYMGLVNTGKLLDVVFKGHKNEVLGIDIDRVGKYFISFADDNMVKLWDLKSHQEVNTFFSHTQGVAAAAISSTGLYMASIGTKDKTLIVRELPKGNVLKEIYIPQKINQISFAPESNRLAIIGEKSTLYLLDIDNNFDYKSLSTSPKYKNNSYVSIDFSYDEKYLMALQNKDNLIIWNLEKQIEYDRVDGLKGDMTFVKVEPNGKKLILASKDENIYYIENLNIVPSLLLTSGQDSDGPKIFLPEFQVGLQKTVTASQIKLNGIIQDRSGVYGATLNGQKLILNSSGDFSQVLNLTFGENKYEIEAMDINGNVSRKSVSVIREDTEQGALAMFGAEPKNFLLVIGANKYQHWSPLSNAVPDAKAVEKVLQDNYGFDEDHTFSLYDENVTAQGLIDIFKKLVNEISFNDNLFIYYSGHGFYDEIEKLGYWVPVDAKQGETYAYFSNDRLLRFIEMIKSRHTFLVADACFSGGLFASSSRGGYYDKIESRKSRWGLASGGLELVSDGKAGQRSPFCSALLDYLENPPKKEFSVGDMALTVKRKVAESSSQLPEANPLDGVGHEGGEMVFRRIK